MSGNDVFLLVTQILGGLALFVFGMQLMSQALQRAAGAKVRNLLFHVTRHRLAGLTVGTTLGTMVHSSATTVMVVGFINAGLLTLAASIPVILGANFGTTLSMQVVSFKLDDYCFVGIAVGLLMELVFKRELLKNLGGILLGFGLLFLGMRIMSAGVAPLKGSGTLELLLRYSDASTISGMFIGIGVSTLVTGIIQSSGATIGMLFALAGAGVFQNIDQVLPLVLGAHIGTCATALLGSIGTNIEARRSAVAHLLFNVLGALLAVAMVQFYRWAVPELGGDLVRQIANAHTLVQAVNVLLFLPFVVPYAKLVEKLTPSKAKPAEHSHLDDRYLDTPEMAIVSALRETRRMAALARRTLVLAMKGLVQLTTEPFAPAQKNEAAVNELKKAIGDYVLRIASHKLSRRQALVVQHVQTAVADIERIGDHATLLIELTTDKVHRRIWFDDASMLELVEMYQRAESILRLTELSLDPQLPKDARKELAAKVLAQRNEYAERSRAIHERHRQRVLDKCEDALTAMFYNRFILCFDKCVRHSKTIAIAELEPMFFVKPKKLRKHARELARPSLPVNGAFKVDERLFDFDALVPEGVELPHHEPLPDFQSVSRPAPPAGGCPDAPDATPAASPSRDDVATRDSDADPPTPATKP
jgi:phosphate:Na+ symporter